MATYYRFVIGLVIVFLAFCPSTSAVHFVLVHGSCIGAWCWYKLATLLEQAGHNVTALDLAYSGRNEVPLLSVQTIDGYHKPLFEYLECLSPEDKVILVGHSYGGLAVSSAMERFPEKLAGAVFLSAYMLGPNLTYNQFMEVFSMADYDYGDSPYIGNPPKIFLWGVNFLATNLYQTSPREDLQLAYYLIRPTQFFYGNLTNRQLLVTKERYGSVPRAYVGGGSDIAIPLSEQRFFIDSNPPKVVREIQGADHMVMQSKPQELANTLLELVGLLSAPN